VIAIQLHSRIKVLLPRVHHIKEATLVAGPTTRPATSLALRRVAQAANRAASLGAGATCKGEQEWRSLKNVYCACVTVHVGDQR